jgi:small subunit ribosomal protein S1
VIQKGDKVTAKVIKLDPEHKKIALSIKEYLVEKNQLNRDDIIVGQKSKKKKKKTSKEEEDEDLDE